MRKIALALLAAFLLSTIALIAIATQIEYDGTAAIASGAHTLNLDGSTGVLQFHRVFVWTSAGAANCNINFNPGVAATAANPILYGGSSLSYGLVTPLAPATKVINYSGASATGTINWIAF